MRADETDNWGNEALDEKEAYTLMLRDPSIKVRKRLVKSTSARLPGSTRNMCCGFKLIHYKVSDFKNLQGKNLKINKDKSRNKFSLFSERIARPIEHFPS